jgi:O-antigen/teichoic acid export membrane protein
VGLFAAAVAITAPLALLPRAISLVTFALMARLHGAGESDSVRALLQGSTEWLVFLLGIPSGLAIINAGPLLGFVFRPEFVPAAAATQLIIAGAYITDISRPSIDGLASTSHVRVATIASFSGLAVSLATWLILVPQDGITAAGLGFALGAAITALIPAFAAILYIGTNPFVFIRPAIMLIGLSVLTIWGHGHLLIASTIFTGGTLLLYMHLIDDVACSGWAMLRSRRAVVA